MTNLNTARQFFLQNQDNSEAGGLLRRVLSNDTQALLGREAQVGSIGHCSVCRKPYPHEPHTKKIVCPDCVDKAEDAKHPIFQGLRDLISHGKAAVSELINPEQTRPVGSSTRPERIPTIAGRKKP